MDNRVAKCGLTTNQMKLIAVIAMLVDHIAILLPSELPGMWALRFVGRFTAPIMFFFIAEGYYHTHDLKRYMGRLFLIAVISHIPHNLAFGFSVWKFWKATDVMFSLLFGLIALAVWKNERYALWKKILVFILCCLFAYPADWNYIAVLYILVLGLLHDDRRRQIIGFIAVSCIYILQGIIYNISMPLISRFGVFCVIPLFLVYSGKHGRKNWFTKWGFYLFYPLHLLVLYGFAQVF